MNFTRRILARIHFISVILTFLNQETLSCECKSETVPETSTGNIGKILVDETYFNLYSRSLTFCADRCLRQRKCKSINFDKRERICALNKETHITKPGHFVTTTNDHVVYYAAADWKQILKTPCSSHECDQEKICITGYMGSGNPSYVCLDTFATDVMAPSIDFGDVGVACVVTNSCTECEPIKTVIVDGESYQYRAVGCYLSMPVRILPTLVSNMRGNIDWSNLEKALSDIVQKCAELSHSYSLFGIEFYGECYAANVLDAAVTQQGEVPITNCNHVCLGGVGGANVMYVYQWL